MKSPKISITEIAQTIVEGSPFVICPSNNKPLPLDTLLYYEPYSRMGKDHIEMLFSKNNDSISPDTLLSLSNFLHHVYQHLVKVLKIPPAELGYHKEKCFIIYLSPGPVGENNQHLEHFVQNLTNTAYFLEEIHW